jgi:phytoene dehydrogenase-like protein
MPDYDAIVIGAGHNGLAAASVLAKEGQRVLTLEKNRYVGGMAATVEIFEGFKFDIAAGTLFPLSRQVVDDLELEKCGLEFVDAPKDVAVGAIGVGTPGDKSLIVYSDAGQMMKHMLEDHGEGAVQGMMALRDFCTTAGESIDRFNALRRPKSLGAIIDAAPTLQAKDMMRIAFFGSAMDLINVFFPDPDKHRVIRGQLAFAAVQSASMGPYSPGTALCLVYTLASLSGDEAYGRHVRGGMGRIMEGLQKSIEAKGGEVRLGSPVKKVSVKNGTAVGVELQSGEAIPASVVLSNLDPYATFIGMVGEDNLPSDFVHGVKRINFNNTYLQIHAALREPPRLGGDYAFANEAGAGYLGDLSMFHSPEHLERSWDACKWGRVPEDPVFTCVFPSRGDDSLAPAGCHTAYIFAYYFPVAAPREQHGRLKNEMADKVIDKITRYAPNFRDAIVNLAVFAPYHYESMFGCTNGDFTHGLIRPEQMCDFRPVVGWSRYKTPVENLYLCGAGCHPGPGVTFLPGYNSAHEVLKSQGR